MRLITYEIANLIRSNVLTTAQSQLHINLFFKTL